MRVQSLDELVVRAKARPLCCMAVVAAHDPEILRSVDEAVKQNMDGTSQLESAAVRLDQLGGKLRKLAETFRV